MTLLKIFMNDMKLAEICG